MPELDLDFFRQCNPMTDEERKKAESDFDKEEEEIRNKLSTRTTEQRDKTANLILKSFLETAMEERGLSKKH